MKVAIIACCKMEELYIIEWLDWHLDICGFNHIFLCDNNDYNYKYELKHIVKKYIDEGKVTIYDYNDVHPIQPYCYDEVYRKHGNEYDWFSIIDIDEFYCLPKYNNNIHEYLSIIHDDMYHIYIPWQIYGDNELIEYDNKYIQERFKNPVHLVADKYGEVIVNGYYYRYKPLFRGKQYFNDETIYIKDQHRGIYDIKDINKNIRYDSNFNKIGDRYGHLLTGINYNIKNAIISYNKSGENIPQNVIDIFNSCHLKHYITKTIDEWVKYKIYRGDTLLKNDDNRYPYTIDKFFHYNNITNEKINFIKEKYNIIN